MESTLVDAILGGSSWALVIALAVAYWRKDSAHIAAHESRVRDAQGVVETLTNMMKDHLTTTQGLTAVLATHANAIAGLNESVKDLREVIERIRDRRGGE